MEKTAVDSQKDIASSWSSKFLCITYISLKNTYKIRTKRVSW